MSKFDVVIIGAGISGITLAERSSTKGKKVLLIEKRNHIGGNCFDFYNQASILVHRYGPHIFHTFDKKVWDYLSQFTKWRNYRHRVSAYVKGKLLPMPINLDTLNGFFGLSLKSEKEARDFLEKKRDKNIKRIKNSRDVIVSRFGEELYDAFVKHYTKKQWDLYPEELDKEVLERLPIRYDNNPYYFDDPYQGIPEDGYTKMFENMLKNKNIQIILNTDYREIIDKIKYKRLYVSSPIDQFFNFKFGPLKYRSLKFVFETLDKDSYQPNSVINYPLDFEFTRITEMKKITGQNHKKTTILKEYPRWFGEPAYPVPQKEQSKILKKYLAWAKKLKNTHFIGRLGSYQYLNMDKAVKITLDISDSLEL